MSPKKINTTSIETSVGEMVACGTDEGICLLEFANRRMLPTELKTLVKLFDAPIVNGESKHFNLLREELNEYFSGNLKKFTVPLVTPGTVFQQQTWQELQRIPYGTTRSYKQQAIAINKPEAVRAVAQANGLNRIAIMIPCHRVIGEDGSMTGYGGGIWRKRWLLDLETGQQVFSH